VVDWERGRLSRIFFETRSASGQSANGRNVTARGKAKRRRWITQRNNILALKGRHIPLLQRFQSIFNNAQPGPLAQAFTFRAVGA